MIVQAKVFFQGFFSMSRVLQSVDPQHITDLVEALRRYCTAVDIQNNFSTVLYSRSPSLWIQINIYIFGLQRFRCFRTQSGCPIVLHNDHPR